MIAFAWSTACDKYPIAIKRAGTPDAAVKRVIATTGREVDKGVKRCLSSRRWLRLGNGHAIVSSRGKEVSPEFAALIGGNPENAKGCTRTMGLSFREFGTGTCSLVAVFETLRDVPERQRLAGPGIVKRLG